MRQIHALYLKWLFYGSRRLCDALRQKGQGLNRKRLQRLMRQIGLRTVNPKPRTSQPDKGHKPYPYLLRDLSIERPNQGWASDIGYIPMAKGFMHLTVMMDGYSRRVLASGSRIPWRPRPVWRLWKKPCCATGLQRSSTRIRAPNTPVRRLRQRSKPMGKPDAVGRIFCRAKDKADSIMTGRNFTYRPV